MRTRLAELAASAALLAGASVLVWTLAFEAPYSPPGEPVPVRHVTDGTAGRAFEDKDTARLALAQFPLPPAANGSADDTSKLIRSVQIELARHGLDAGPADGIPTPRLRDAIAEYQRRMGLEVTGEPSRLLLEHLGVTQPLRKAASPPESDQMIRLVARVQKQLGDLGYPAGKPNGVLTGRTRDAIARFERDTGLPVTGKVSFQLVQLLSKFEYTPL